MARGIKKISENVIANNRSLTLVTASSESALALNDPQGQEPKLYGVTNTEAMPLGMLNVDYSIRGLSMKVSQGEKDSNAVWSRFDAKHTLIQQSIITNLIKDDNITTEKIGPGEVQTRNIKDQNVTTPKIADAAVTTEKIRDLNVTTEKINNNAVTEVKLSGDMSGGKNCAVSTRTIQNRAITEPKIEDQAVSTRTLRNLSVTDTKLADNAVVTRTIKNSAVTESKIADGAVTEWKIADGAIHSHNIAIGGVATQNLQDYCVTNEKINNLAVTNDKIADETIVGSDKIVKNSITKDRLELSLIDALDRAVLHDGSGNVTGENYSTQLNNIKATGDIYAHRVYNVVYMDIAEGYIPGEDLEPGDIVAIHKDGKVYKANTINDCIVGVVSNEFAHCLGTSEEELIAGNAIAVGMIGKIHVKVKGPVRLGQRISLSNQPGIGCANWMNNNNIGQALETIQCGYDEINTVLVQVRPM